MPARETSAGTGHVHEAVFYNSDDEFRTLILEWIEEGIRAGEPVVIAYDERKAALLRSWLNDSSGVTFVPQSGVYDTPAGALAKYRQIFEHQIGRGAERIRITGEVPHLGIGREFHGWDRYEIAINTVWDGLPLWTRCIYDAAVTPAAVRDAVIRAHPYVLIASGGTRANERYEDISTFPGLPAIPDPITVDTAPMVEVLDPTPAEARRVLGQIGRGEMDDDTLDDLILGVSEAVTNTRLHGGSATSLRVWVTPGRITAHVHDSGTGTRDPLVGLIPAPSGPAGAGLGLWITHQLDLTVDLLHMPDGFTVQLIAKSNAAT